MKKLLTLLALVLGVVTFFGVKSINADSYPPNCGTSAVVQCGVYEQEDMDAARSDAKALYSSLGVSTNINSAKQGVVYPNGEVKVNDELVATGGMTFGRVKRTANDIAYKAGETTFWKHSIVDALITKPVEAYVFLDSEGSFKGAIIRMCGNPVVAKPVEKPEPKPESITCDILKVDILNTKTREVEAKITGTAEYTTITAYKIDFGDGTVINQQTATHTYGEYGKYTITAYVTGTVDGKEQTVTSAACQKEVEFKKPPEPLEQSLTCDILNLDLFNEEKKYVKVSIDATAQNTTIDSYEINFGDGSSSVMEQTAEHTFGDFGKYTIKGYVTGVVDGEELTVGGENGCVQTVEFTAPPEEPETPEVPKLPDTGAGALVGLFSGVSLLGAVGHRMWTIRRLN